jgi:hypothetical protein
LPFAKYESDRIHPVRLPYGSTRNVAGSGTSVTSGKPVISSMPKPPPAANAGGKTPLAESRL